MDMKLQTEAKSAYEAINHQWLHFHHRFLNLCVFSCFLLEVAMFIIIQNTGRIYESITMYWVKYIITPTLIGILIIVASHYIMKSKQITNQVKQYLISFMTMLFAFDLSMMHSGFISILCVAIFPILMTAIYEDKRLTATIAISSIPLQLIAGLSIFWDVRKEVSHEYIINLILIVAITCFTWMLCHTMMRFAKMKKEIIIQNDVERKQLHVEISLDALTRVGSKQALFNYLETIPLLPEHTLHLTMIDVDNFKEINDTYGHSYGDTVLKCLGTALNKMDQSCLAYRYGGDEFCMLTIGKKKEQLLKMIEELQTQYRTTLAEMQHDMDISISAGIAFYHVGMNTSDLIDHADEALYASKRNIVESITYYDML